MTSTPSPGETLRREFGSDNTAGASPQIIEAVAAAAAGAASPYGNDIWTERLTDQLAEIFDHRVHLTLVSTGTAANVLSLASLTPSWGAVLCHRDSHVVNDECSAPEFFTGGARLVGLPGADAKIAADELAAAVRLGRGDVHKVQPATLTLTQATETGGIYSLSEIEHLSSVADEAGLRVHMDGARFTNALVALGCSPAEMTWQAGVEVLSFGTTKNGTMTAEAIIAFDESLGSELDYRAKRAGQLSSKMRFQAAQLQAYLADDLWLHNARHANAMAQRLRSGLAGIPAVTVQGAGAANIVFCHLPELIIDGLHAAGFSFHANRWGPQIARFVTSFATTNDDVDALVNTAAQLS